MGSTLAKCALFPAPFAELQRYRSPNIVWDEQPRGTCGGGVRRPFLWLQAPSKAQVTVFYLHANSDDLSTIEVFLSRLCQHLRADVLAIEYPGYGLLQRPDIVDELDTVHTIIDGIDAAAVHGLRYLVSTRGIPSLQVLLYGYSIGTGPALHLARYARDHLRLNVGGIVLQSGFISIKQVMFDRVGAIAECIVPVYYDNLAAVRALCSTTPAAADMHWIPLLFLHGELDDIVDPYHSRTLCQEAIRRGHPHVEASFGHSANHQEWDVFYDLALPILDFMLKHVCTTTGLAKQAELSLPNPFTGFVEAPGSARGFVVGDTYDEPFRASESTDPDHSLKKPTFPPL